VWSARDRLKAGKTFVLDLYLTKSDPRSEREHAHIALRKLAECVKNDVIDKKAVRAMRRYLMQPNDATHQSVVQSGEARWARTSHRRDDLRIPPPRVDHRVQCLWRVLKIRGHHDRGAALRAMQTARNRHV
jgi:hypothetical protein